MDKNKVINSIINYFSNHPNQTKNPQSYCKHAGFAVYNSFQLVIAGFIGMFHGIFPFCFPFYTSTVVVQSFKGLIESERHNNEVLDILRGGIKDKKIYEVEHDNKAPGHNNVKNLRITIKVDTI
tara:strand:+ start:1518 stop:1889 length:372 start_codon:yes stop_codon:yes gene_type:complete